jgi:hypothetical protein
MPLTSILPPGNAPLLLPATKDILAEIAKHGFASWKATPFDSAQKPNKLYEPKKLFRS